MLTYLPVPLVLGTTDIDCVGVVMSEAVLEVAMLSPGEDGLLVGWT